jgi:hypothetical protein
MKGPAETGSSRVLLWVLTVPDILLSFPDTGSRSESRKQPGMADRHRQLQVRDVDSVARGSEQPVAARCRVDAVNTSRVSAGRFALFFVVSRREFRRFPQVAGILVAGSIPGSSTKGPLRCGPFFDQRAFPVSGCA